MTVVSASSPFLVNTMISYPQDKSVHDHVHRIMITCLFHLLWLLPYSSYPQHVGSVDFHGSFGAGYSSRETA